MQPIHDKPLSYSRLDREFEMFRETIISYRTDLRDYHQVLEKLLAEAEAKDADKVLASVDHLEEPRRSEVLAWHIPYWWADTFVPQFRASFAVWAISVLEFHLEWASRLAGGFAQIPPAAEVKRNRNRSTVARYEEFFIRLAGFKEPANKAWMRLADLYTIRKALAHSGAYVLFETEKRKDNLTQAMKSFRGITLGEHKVMLEIDEAFCDDVIDLAGSFCSYLLAQLTCAREAFLRRNPGRTV